MALSKTYLTVNGQLRSEHRSGEAKSRDYVHDALGNVVAIFQDDWPIAIASYDPYGEFLTNWNMSSYKFTWNGSHGYRQTGLEWSSTYVRARHYSFMDAAWTTRDPLWPQEMPYGYVDGRVMRANDPSGMQALVLVKPDPTKKDPCSCPGWGLNFQSRVGYVYIDCNCRGKGIGILPEKGGNPINVRPKCGEWIQVDAVIFYQALLSTLVGTIKIHGQTCVVVDCRNGAPTVQSYCCNQVSRIRGKCEPEYVDFDSEFGKSRRCPGQGVVVEN